MQYEEESFLSVTNDSNIPNTHQYQNINGLVRISHLYNCSSGNYGFSSNLTQLGQQVNKKVTS